ncbi:anaphase-promoting complex subunit 4-like [Pollicipes pollicipes]|uniref:anaphase-promoting complex subunit 4-like n=1 Tax=Pollicipes pollicipes TaxID=41117 RepID=UPI0018853305|nr:anaphase-promoting complex subunit 4-like [Pollicipes pollicipes]
MADIHMEQTYEKQLPAEVSSMVWSPKMDLIAFSLASGGVALYRMTLHRVWSVDPPEEGVSVSALCWRPDGRVLAVAYTSGLLSYLDLESGETVHSETFATVAVCLSWAQRQEPAPDPPDGKTEGEEDSFDEDEDFLPPLPSLSKQYGSANRHSEEDPQDVQGIADMKSLTVLAVGTQDGQVTLLLHGLLVFGRHSCGAGVAPRAMAFSADLARLMVLCSEQDEPGGEAWLLELDLSVLSESSEQLRQLATLYGRITSHLLYLDRTIQAICEAWETVLVEMDSKMERFQASLGENSSLSVEFLELMMFGVPSPEMEQFLLSDLTDTGLKKLRHSIELSYTNIQSLVLRHLQSVGLRIADQLDQVAGMARHTERFGHLGLSGARVAAAQQAAALFLIKATELQQVIDSSTRNFKAFFRWLYVVMLRLAEVAVPPDYAKVSQKELSFIAEFIDTNLGDSVTARGVHLERVGMYLRSAELETPPAHERNAWRRLLVDSAELAATPGVVAPTNGARSLLQERDALRRAIAQLFADTDAAEESTLDTTHGSGGELMDDNKENLL